MNIRIGYYGKDENVHSTLATCMNVIETAKYLETVADNWAATPLQTSSYANSGCLQPAKE